MLTQLKVPILVISSIIVIVWIVVHVDAQNKSQEVISCNRNDEALSQS